MKVFEAAQKLDEVKPDWYTRVNLDTLNLEQSETCVLGQAFADETYSPYSYGLEQLGLDPEDPNASLVFDSNDYRHEWVQEILNRRAGLVEEIKVNALVKQFISAYEEASRGFPAALDRLYNQYKPETITVEVREDKWAQYKHLFEE